MIYQALAPYSSHQPRLFLFMFKFLCLLYLRLKRVNMTQSSTNSIPSSTFSSTFCRVTLYLHVKRVSMTQSSTSSLTSSTLRSSFSLSRYSWGGPLWYGTGCSRANSDVPSPIPAPPEANRWGGRVPEVRAPPFTSVGMPSSTPMPGAPSAGSWNHNQMINLLFISSNAQD